MIVLLPLCILLEKITRMWVTTVLSHRFDRYAERCQLTTGNYRTLSALFWQRCGKKRRVCAWILRRCWPSFKQLQSCQAKRTSLEYINELIIRNLNRWSPLVFSLLARFFRSPPTTASLNRLRRREWWKLDQAREKWRKREIWCKKGGETVVLVPATPGP